MKKNIIMVLGVIILSNCTLQKKVIFSSKINTKLNKENYNARKTFYGKLNEKEYIVLIKEIEKSLNLKINKNQNLLINFKQNGENCILAGLKSRRISEILSRTEEISEKFTRLYFIQNLLVYSKDSYFIEFLSERKKWVKDSGFINAEIFKLKESCSAFFLIKTTGEFCIYYGGDYFSFVKNRLEVKDWSDKKSY